jgi:hypothetical protein
LRGRQVFRPRSTLDLSVLESRYQAELRPYLANKGKARFDDAPLAGNAVRGDRQHVAKSS